MRAPRCSSGRRGARASPGGAALAFVGALALTAPAAAQPSDNDFAIDLFQGPILAPTRVTALAGAYAAYAEGIAGHVANAASPAVRSPTSSSWVDFDVDASFSIPLSLFDNNDFDNSGDLDADYSSFIYLTGGGQVQVGPFGAGASADVYRYTLSLGADDTVVTVGRYRALAGWQFLGGQLTLGAGVRMVTLSITAEEGDFTMIGAAPQYGLLIRPDWAPFRLGATFRHPVQGGTSVGTGKSVDPAGVERAGGLIVPARVVEPWELHLGFAVQVGARPLNPRWIDPEAHEAELHAAHAARAHEREQRRRARLDEVTDAAARSALAQALAAEEAEQSARARVELRRELELLVEERRARARNWPREHLLLTFDLLMIGNVPDAIHIERFLSQGQPQPASSSCVAVASGEEINFSPRFGIEMEPVPRYVHTRLGSYYEPNRFRYTPEPCGGRPGRQHFTFGADVKLFSTTWWGLVPEVTYTLQGYGDLAPRYQSFGGGFGVWY